MLYVFMVFYGGVPQAGLFLGGTQGNQEAFPKCRPGVSPPAWHFRHNGLFSGCCAFSRGVHNFVHMCR